ncbi:hypothetical protein RN001_003886 [Aquatica leii]|uniref:Ig-like domain-containing protein n=1 Tax=Aquatica leii TaxID=1421715 RepID=A0AAN7QC05_9COLE|nr:hypothetical protein RN001_003886 [Aquatica leii]
MPKLTSPPPSTHSVIVDGLKLTNLIIPVLADSRKPMQLDCQFDMEGEELSSVMWYKDNAEFFRYTPNTMPNKKVFPVKGVRLVLPNTDCNRQHCKIELDYLSKPTSAGLYSCQITSESPTFSFAHKSQNVTIATLPLEEPKLEGLQDFYSIGDILEANCTSSPSDPASILSWYINGDQVPRDLIGKTKVWVLDGLEAQSTSLRFEINHDYLGNESDIIQLQCVSTLPDLPILPQRVTKSIRINFINNTSNIFDSFLSIFF